MQHRDAAKGSRTPSAAASSVLIDPREGSYGSIRRDSARSRMQRWGADPRIGAPASSERGSAPEGGRKALKPSAPHFSILRSVAGSWALAGTRPPQKPTSTMALPCARARGRGLPAGPVHDSTPQCSDAGSGLQRTACVALRERPLLAAAAGPGLRSALQGGHLRGSPPGIAKGANEWILPWVEAGTVLPALSSAGPQQSMQSAPLRDQQTFLSSLTHQSASRVGLLRGWGGGGGVGRGGGGGGGGKGGTRTAAIFCFRMAGVVVVGTLLSGMSITVVTPPAAAPRVPEVAPAPQQARPRHQ